MSNVCNQKQLVGWRKARCTDLASAIEGAMSVDNFFNRESFTSVKALFAAKAWDLNTPATMERFAAAVAARSEFEGLVITVKEAAHRPAVQQTIVLQQLQLQQAAGGLVSASSAVSALALVPGQSPSSPLKKKKRQRDPIKYPGSSCKVEVTVPGIGTAGPLGWVLFTAIIRRRAECVLTADTSVGGDTAVDEPPTPVDCIGVFVTRATTIIMPIIVAPATFATFPTRGPLVRAETPTAARPLTRFL